MSVRLTVMLLVHERHELIMPIVRQVSALRCADLVLGYDRPNLRVQQLCSQIVASPPDGLRQIKEVILDQPVLAPGKPERWMEARQQTWEARAPDTTHGVVWDDDHILEDLAEARNVLYGPEFDLCYATKTYFWDDAEHVNTRCFLHRSPFFFRALPRDSYPMDRIIHAPKQIHDNAKQVIDLKGKLLDFGYLKEEDRLRVWNAYKRSGKLDAATTPLILPPTLEPYTGKKDCYYAQAAKSYRD